MKPSPIKEQSFEIESKSTGAIYQIVIHRTKKDALSIICTCPAGETMMHCKHKDEIIDRIIDGDYHRSDIEHFSIVKKQQEELKKRATKSRKKAKELEKIMLYVDSPDDDILAAVRERRQHKKDVREVYKKISSILLGRDERST